MRQMLRGADAGDDILALGIDQIFAVKLVVAGRRVAGKGDAGRAIRAHIAEHHRLDIDRGAPIGRDLVQPAIGDRARVHPRAEDRADRAPQLVARLLRERLAGFLRDHILEPGDDDLPVLGREIGVERLPAVELVVFDQLLEMMVLDAEHDLPVHLDEAAIAVIGKALVAALAGQALDRPVVEPEIEDGIHHPRHRHPRTRADRDQKRIVGVAKPRAERPLDRREPVGDLRLKIGRIGLAVGIEPGADLGGDRKAGRHRQPEIAHLGEPRALAAEQVAHPGAPLGAAAAKSVDPFRHPPLTLRSARNRRPGSSSRGSAPTGAAGSRAVSHHRC